MRKHHSNRGSGRVTPRATRRTSAGIVAGAAAAGSLFLPHVAGATTGPRWPARQVPASVRVHRHHAALDATTTSSPLWLVGPTGAVSSPTGAPVLGQPSNPAAPIVAGAATTDGQGYWLVGADGGIFAYGDAGYYGSMGGQQLDEPIVGFTPTPDDKGYWLVAADGGIFAFGDAAYHGSMGGHPLNQPIVAMAATPSGGGYWLVAADGGVFAFGDAPYLGSTGSLSLSKPIVAMAATPSGGGYWLVGADGGVFTFGDAPFDGSTAAEPPPAGVRGIVADPSGGYWLADAAGNLYQFGAAGTRPPVVVATTPSAATAEVASDSAAQKAIAFAEAQVGKPYVYGGTGPDGYDCSGLTQAAWAAAGVSIARVAAGQFDDGTQVPVTDAQPGDLIFWSSSSSPADIYHVGIDLGNGMMVDAPHTGATVTVEPIYPGVYPVAVQP